MIPALWILVSRPHGAGTGGWLHAIPARLPDQKRAADCPEKTLRRPVAGPVRHGKRLITGFVRQAMRPASFQQAVRENVIGEGILRVNADIQEIRSVKQMTATTLPIGYSII